MESNIIETGVDKLVKIVKQKGRIGLDDAAKELGISSDLIKEWVGFLESEGILSVEYKLTKPFLVDKKHIKNKIDSRVAAFKSQPEPSGEKLETGVDKLIILVRQKGRIGLDDAAKELGISSDLIKEWVGFLEEDGLLGVEYKFTKPFLVDKKLTKKEIDARVAAIKVEPKHFSFFHSIFKNRKTKLVMDSPAAEASKYKSPIFVKNNIKKSNLIKVPKEQPSSLDFSRKKIEKEQSRCNSLIMKSNESIILGKREKAMKYYDAAKEAYMKLDYFQKKDSYDLLLSLYNKLKEDEHG